MDKSGTKSLNEIAKAVAEITTISSEEAIEALLDSIERIPGQLQMMIDTIVGMQAEWPMPQEGWERFVGDIQRTNKRFGYNLRIDSMFGSIAYSRALEKYAASVNKTRHELDENERKQAMMDAVLADAKERSRDES